MVLLLVLLLAARGPPCSATVPVPSHLMTVLTMLHDRMPFHVHVWPQPPQQQQQQQQQNLDLDYPEYGEVFRPQLCQYCRCGVPNRATRIVGGRPTLVNEFPWVAALTRNGKVYCGATLINSQYVLTAAHCVQGNSLVIRMNTLVLLSEHDTSLASETLTVSRHVAAVHRHPDFQPTRGNFDGDLALLQLARPVRFRPEVSPACLPPPDVDFSGQTGTVAGWGRLSELGLPSAALQVIEVPILEQQQCLSQTPYPPTKLTDHMLCAGPLAGGADSCQGDSGGALLVKDANERLVTAGVVSWGEGCARPSRPGVYTRVNHYLPWIQRVTQDACYCS